MKKDKLYTANRWNQPALMSEGNLFLGGGSTSQMNFGRQTSLPPLESYLPKGLSNDTYRNLAIGSIGQMQNAFQNYGKSIVDNFGKGPLTQNNSMLYQKDPSKFFGSTSSGDSDKGSFRGSGNTMATIGAAVGALDAVNTGDPRGLWDTLDPVYHIAGGRESGAGNAMSDAGVAVTKAGLSSGQPWMALAGAGLKIVGGLTNAAVGIKENTALKKAVEEGIDRNKNFVSKASNFDDVKSPVAAVTNTNVYKGGWFSGGKARRKNEELRRRMADATQWASRSVDNNIFNIADDQMNNALANYSAFGGPIETEDMGAIGYGFMSDYLTQKKRENDMKSKMGGIAAMPAFMPNSFAIGGDLQTNGGDFSSGLTRINAGGSHSENPNEGVQLGVDSENVPNLVEEGETIWNDYVFSARIPIDQTTKEMFHIGKKREMTYADLSKKLEKEIAERVNDPISKAGFNAQMQQLEEQQERQKQEMEAERAKAAFEALSPVEQTALMQQKAEQEALAQQQAMAEQQAAMQQPTQEEMLLAQQQQQMMADGSEAVLGQEPEIAANGGKLFAPGGYLWDKFWSPVNEYSKKKGNTKGKYQIDKEWKGNIKELEDSEAYKAFTNYILNDATDEERMKYFQWIDANTGRDNKYITNGKLADNWKDMYQSARTDGLYGIQHYTPEFDPNLGTVVEDLHSPRVVGMSRIGQRKPLDVFQDIDEFGNKTIISTPISNVDVSTISSADSTKPTDKNGTSEGIKKKGIAPDLQKETYFGLFGPAVGLGLMGLGIGKPDIASYDAAASGAGNYTTANWKPLGNYLTYRPLDIWYEQNALNTQSRATDRALANNSGGNRGTAMAGLIANGYNSQLASGNLFRQAQEYNDALRQKVEDFNRGTDQFNSEQYGATSRFNADAYNNANRASAQMKLHAASAKDDANRWWASNLYGNINSLFDNINQWEKWKRDHNSVARMAANGIFGVGTEDTPVFGGYVKESKKSKGGKLKKRGLTI